MLFLKGLTSTGYLISEGSYQRLKHVTTVEALVTLCNDDLAIRLGKAYLNGQIDEMGSKAMYLAVINDERSYVSDYAIRVDPTLHYFEIATQLSKYSMRIWRIPERFISTVIFAYYSSPDSTLYEELLDRLSDAITYSQ